MTVDTQRDHFWALVRAWRADGSSRLIWEGKVLTIETIIDIGKRLNIREKLTFIDAQYATGQVYDWAARFKLTALHGSGRDGFTHIGPRGNVKKFFSPMKTAAAPSGGTASYIYWSNEPMKDALVKLRSQGSPHWEFPSDVSKDYLDHLNSEVKREVLDKETKRMKMRWVRIGSRQNHLWDCEAMQVAVATMMRVLRDEPQVVGVDTPADKL
jgi:Phage terminase large subunit (GpA)